MADFVGLEWDERMLRFYEQEREVKTASKWQVRQPLYNEFSCALEALRKAAAATVRVAWAPAGLSRCSRCSPQRVAARQQSCDMLLKVRWSMRAEQLFALIDAVFL